MAASYMTKITLQSPFKIQDLGRSYFYHVRKILSGLVGGFSKMHIKACLQYINTYAIFGIILLVIDGFRNSKKYAYLIKVCPHMLLHEKNV